MPISGEKSLQRLLQSMQPALLEATYCFATVPKGRPVPADLSPLATFLEPEGWTLILTDKEAATSGLQASYFCRCISLNIHSSLYAVGFLAAIAGKLAQAGMSINIVSAFHRDYIFVPTDRAREAIDVLKKLAAE